MSLKGSILSNKRNKFLTPYYVDVLASNSKAINCKCCLNYLTEDVICCPKGCDTVYCSESCIIIDNKSNGHWITCVGSTKTRTYPMTCDFNRHSALNNTHYKGGLAVFAKIIALGVKQCTTGTSNFKDALRLSVTSFFKLFPDQSGDISTVSQRSTGDYREAKLHHFCEGLIEKGGDKAMEFGVRTTIMHNGQQWSFSIIPIREPDNDEIVNEHEHKEEVLNKTEIENSNGVIEAVTSKSISNSTPSPPVSSLAAAHQTNVEEDSEAHADLLESYSLLSAVLKFEKTSELLSSANISKEDWLEAMDELTLPLYGHVIRLIEKNLVPLKIVTPLPPLLEELKSIAHMEKFEKRQQAVETHKNLATAVTSFLIPSTLKEVIVSDGFVLEQTTNKVLEVERSAARLAQAADLAATSDTSDNPLSGHVLTVMALIPAVYCVPTESQASDKLVNHRLQHSCVPNVHLEAVLPATSTSGSVKLKVQTVALRNILPNEPLTYCYVNNSSKMKERHSELFQKLNPSNNTENGIDVNTTSTCYCLKCQYDTDSQDFLHRLVSSFVTAKGLLTLQEGVDRYENSFFSLSVVGAADLMSVCTSSLSQYLLLEILNINQQQTHEVSNRSIDNHFNLLNDALTLADVLMQETKVEQALIVYCSIVLSFYYSNNSSQSSAEDVTQLIGDVLLSIGNILLDIAIQPSTEKSSVHKSEDIATSNSLAVMSTKQKAIADMFQSSPFQLCHSIWRNGLVYLKNQTHSGINTHISDLKAYDFVNNLGSSSSSSKINRPSVADVTCLNNFHSVSFVKPTNKQHKSTSQRIHPSIYLSKDAILSLEDCQYAIQTAEKHATEHMNGSWTTSRHYAVPTTDIPVQEVPVLLQWFNEIMREVLAPMLRAQFMDVDNVNGCVAVHDAFIVKYQCDEEEGDTKVKVPSSKQRYLPLHSDQSTHSLTVALNPSSHYTGGGTYFADLNTSLRPDCGQVLSFEGELLHGGDPVTSGTRYILAIFLLLKTHQPVITLNNLTETEINSRKRKGNHDEGGSSLAKMFKSRATDELNVNGANGGAKVDDEDNGNFSFSFL